MNPRLPQIAFFTLTAVPITAGIIYSFLYSLGLAGLLGKGFTLQHWATLIGNSEVWYSLAYTTILTLIALALTLAIALPLSYALHFLRPSRWLESALFIPLAAPPLIAAFAWNHLLRPSGIASRVTHHLGITQGIDGFPRLVEDWASVGITVTHVFLIFPFFTIYFLNAARKENLTDLRDLAHTLGASPWRFFRTVFVPLLMLRARGITLLYAVFLFGAYEVPLLLGRSTPRTVTLLIVDKVTKFNLADIPMGHAIAVLYALLVGILVAVFIRRHTMGQHSSP